MLRKLITSPKRENSPSFVLLALLSLGLSVNFTSFPWELISGNGFPDRENTLLTISSLAGSDTGPLEMGFPSIFYIFFSEWLWQALLLFTVIFFDDPINGILLISFVSVFMITFILAKHTSFLYAIVLFLSPTAIDLFISQSRSALALALFMTALICRKFYWRYLLLALAFFIHNLVWILFSVFLVSRFLLNLKFLTRQNKLWAAFFLGLAISVALKVFLMDILVLLGDRRAFQDASEGTSIAFVFWWMVLSLMIVSLSRLGRTRINDHYIILGIVLLALFVFSGLLGRGEIRYLALSLPFVLIAVYSFRESLFRTFAIGGVVTFNIIHFGFWM
jgi:hypothetical protein